jgi:2-succinyl-6-hydroxy-2,4-cyclohexadiene-1-carboxylate synthase
MNADSNGCLSRDGDEVYFEVVGDPEAPVVVLGHGAGGNHAIWFQQVPVFEREYRVITWDQRGFGNSTNRNGLANPRTATSDLLAILDHLEVERAHVVGQSMGGWAALGLAIAHRARVQSLVLADTLGGIAIDGWWKAAAAIAPRVGPFNHPALANDFCLRNPERAHLYLQIGGLRRDPLSDQSPMLLAMADVSYSDEQLAALEIPTLFVVGTEDEIFPPASIAEAASRVPGARVEEIEGAGHSPYFEQPGLWNALVEGFWFRLR